LYSPTSTNLTQYVSVLRLTAITGYIHTNWPSLLRYTPIRLLGTWTTSPLDNETPVPSTGLLSWLTPPEPYLPSPPHNVELYTLTVVALSVFGTFLLLLNPDPHSTTIHPCSCPRGVTLRGTTTDPDHSLQRLLRRTILPASALGATLIALLCVLADVLDVLGGGYGVLCCSGVFYALFEKGEEICRRGSMEEGCEYFWRRREGRRFEEVMVKMERECAMLEGMVREENVTERGSTEIATIGV
jgi:preprotein translocase subunit SecY